MTESKECFKCNITKPMTEYYKHLVMGDGHLGKCKDCAKADVKARRSEKMKDPTWVAKERSRGREKYKRLGYSSIQQSKEARRKSTQNYRTRYPEKYAATCATSKLHPSVEGNHLHHWSYNEEHYTDVIELTQTTHYFVHLYLTYDAEKFMYRCDVPVLNFNYLDLLDTREKHLMFIGACKETFNA